MTPCIVPPRRSLVRVAIAAAAASITLISSIAAATAADLGAADTPVPTASAGVVIAPTPAERADLDRIRALFIDGAVASDARVRTFVGVNQVFLDDDQLPAARRVPVDTLAEQARGSTDPFVLSLLVDACGRSQLVPKPTCDPVALARRSTELLDAGGPELRAAAARYHRERAVARERSAAEQRQRSGIGQR